MFVRIRLPIGQPHPALFVVDRAIGSDQGLKYVYVIDAEKKVQYRRVKTGALEDDELRVVEPFDARTASGLRPDELVVVGALQQLRPRTEVDPAEGPMPTPAPRSRPRNPAAGRRRLRTPVRNRPRTPAGTSAPRITDGRPPCSPASSSTARSSPRSCRSSSP
jgi:multidrug efflux system membrane fusion protein